MKGCCCFMGKLKSKKRVLLLAAAYIIVAVTFFSVALSTLYNDKAGEDGYWVSAMKTDEKTQKRYDELSKDALEVTVGTYVETIKEISIKNSSFTVGFTAWYSWEGGDDYDPVDHTKIYNGTISHKEVAKSIDEGDSHYRRVDYVATIHKNFWTIRYPLESHQLRIYLQSEYTAGRVVYRLDRENSDCGPSLSINGYDVVRHDVSEYAIKTDSNYGDPELSDDAVYSEIVTAIEINRNSMGVYVKCVIALFGTSLWVLIVLFINTQHRVDPLSMIPAALFGAVSNIMVGANLLPDALQMGLLEYVNILGIMTILGGAISIINVNRVRAEHKDFEYAKQIGRTMFIIVLTTAVLGHVLLPLTAYAFI